LQMERIRSFFVSFLIEVLEIEHVQVVQAADDADTLIVLRALELAKVSIVSVVANDTDVLVLLVYHVSKALYDIYWHYEVSSRVTRKVEIVSVKKNQNSCWRSGVSSIACASCHHWVRFNFSFVQNRENNWTQEV
jgi:hypothetical protein